MKLEATGSRHTKRIVDDDGKLLAMAEQYTNDLWAVVSVTDYSRLCNPVHKTAGAALRWFKSERKNGG